MVESKISDEEGVYYKYGDRRQELVFIGTNLQPETLEEGLKVCLLSDEEMTVYTTNLPTGNYSHLLIPLHVPWKDARSLVIICRHGQNQHLMLYPGFSVTLSTPCPRRGRREPSRCGLTNQKMTIMKCCY